MHHPALRRGPAPRRFDHGEPMRAIDARLLLFAALIVGAGFLLVTGKPRPHALLVALPMPDTISGLSGDYVVANRVSVTGKRQIMWNGWLVSAMELGALLKTSRRMEPQPDLIFEPDGDAP